MAWAPVVGGSAQPSCTTSEFLSCRLNCDLSHVSLSSLTACLLALLPHRGGSSAASSRVSCRLSAAQPQACGC